jgi:SAM-dependent methyltransferase
MSFKDHFSRQSAAYRRYRPGYPLALFEFVAARAPDRRLAVDCATGNGQAAVGLARHFDSVLAVDGSTSQLAGAEPSARVLYVAALAERLPVAEHSASLVTAAQAVHWFDFDRFHAECRRVLVPGGLLAVWSYEKFRVDAAVDAVIDRFYTEVVGDYWPPERRYVAHLLFATTSNRGKFHGNPVEIIEDLIPLRDTQVRLRLPRKVKSVRLVPDGSVLPFTVHTAGVEFTVPEFTAHQMIELRY